jgi:desulfoferrodoxin (superoxide reductase-like protein)
MKPRWTFITSVAFLALVLVFFPPACKKQQEISETPAAETPAAAPQAAPMMEAQGNSMANPYTSENPGPWAEKVNTHLPQITYEKTGSGLKVTIKVDEHPMDPQQPHFIMSIMLHDGTGAMLGEKAFVATDPAPIATFELMSVPEKLIAYEHCNIHGFWKAETAVMAQ